MRRYHMQKITLSLSLFRYVFYLYAPLIFLTATCLLERSSHPTAILPSIHDWSLFLIWRNGAEPRDQSLAWIQEDEFVQGMAILQILSMQEFQMLGSLFAAPLTYI